MRPFALVESGARGVRITAANASAQSGGVRAAMALTDARALVPDLVTEPVDRAGDAADLRRLALWARRYTPWTRVRGRDGLALDITGCAHLWGDEAGLVADVGRRLEALGLRAQIAVGDTLDAAWALARYHVGPVHIASPGGGLAAVSGLPVQALALDPAATRTLARFGLRTVGDVAGMSRRALARRFSGRAAEAVLDRLDRLTGRMTAPFEPLAPAPAYAERLACAEPLITHDAIAAGLDTLMTRLMAQMSADQCGATRLVFQVCRSDGGAGRIAVRAAAPSRDKAHWLRLLGERLERLDPGYGVDVLILEASDVARTDTVVTPAGLLADGAAQGRDAALTRFIDRACARLGLDAVLRPHACADWTPERAERLAPVHARGEGAGDPDVIMETAPRPARMFDPPEPAAVVAALPDGSPTRITWRRTHLRIVRAEGPERISPAWWRDIGAADPDRPRDYYRVETDDGRRLWVFREGLYDAVAAERPPVWRVHGVFP